MRAGPPGATHDHRDTHKTKKLGVGKRPTRVGASGPPNDVTRGPPGGGAALDRLPLMTSLSGWLLERPQVVIDGSDWALAGQERTWGSRSHYSALPIITSRFPHLEFQW